MVKAVCAQSDDVRVAVLKGVDSVRLDGSGLTAVDGSGEPLPVRPPLLIRREGKGISVNGLTLGSLRASAPGPVLVNGKGYRGEVEIFPLDRGVVAVNDLPMEDYLAGIINSEISSLWPMDAVKAQAVVARSFARFQREARKNMPYHLEATVMDQVYEGCDIEDSRAVRGVRETAGEVLTYNGRVIQAFFHSSCGGHTEAVERVWSLDRPYLRGVKCGYCLDAPSTAWEQTIPLKKLESSLRAAGYPVSGLRGIIPLERNGSGRVDELSIISDRGAVAIPAVAFRKAMGYGVIRSTNFDLRPAGDGVIFTGLGHGHGVGLCQWGAKKRAEEGFSYREILSYYYPGTTLEGPGAKERDEVRQSGNSGKSTTPSN